MALLTRQEQEEVQQQQINQFEAKWGMIFVEFVEKFGAGDLGLDSYAYEVEADFWAWEQAETLRQHYGESSEVILS